MQNNLYDIAHKMLQEPKGLLAADESTTSMNKRLGAVELPQEEGVRRQYRQLLFTTPDIERYISGVILYDETIRQQSDDGEPFATLLADRGIIPGIKVDQGLIDDPLAPGEQVTQGIKGLADRLKEYKEMGAQFTKWRAVDHISNLASDLNQENIKRTSRCLALYAKIVQEAGMVPMVEPEVLKAGDHSIKEAEKATRAILETLFKHMEEREVDLEGLILKTSMVVTGSDSGETIESSEVAERTVRVLRDTVPKETAGVTFLSGGQQPIEATQNLQAIAEKGPHPWPVTFSFSRALHSPVLSLWKGNHMNAEAAQKLFLHRAKMNALARMGNYTSEQEKEHE